MDDLFEQKNLIMESAALGASIALNRLGLIKDEISQREAFRVYGESLVRTWLNRGWITRIKPGALRPIPRPEIKTADASMAKRRAGCLPRPAM